MFNLVSRVEIRLKELDPEIELQSGKKAFGKSNQGYDDEYREKEGLDREGVHPFLSDSS